MEYDHVLFDVEHLPAEPREEDAAQLVEQMFRRRVERLLSTLPSQAILETSVRFDGRGGCAIQLGLSCPTDELAAALDAIMTETGGFVGLARNSAELGDDDASGLMRLLPAPPEASPAELQLWPAEGLDLPTMLEHASAARDGCVVHFWFARVSAVAGLQAMLNRRVKRLVDRGLPTPVKELIESWTTVDGLYRLDVLASAQSRLDLDRLATTLCPGRQLTMTQFGRSADGTGDMVESILRGRILPLRAAATFVPLSLLPSSSEAPVRRRPVVEARYVEPSGAGAVELGTGVGGRRVTIAASEFAQHSLITGLPGFGKTTTAMALLWRLWRDQGIPFLVIDPEKLEYLRLAEALATEGDEVSVLRLGGPSRLTINPLAVPTGVDSAAFAAAFAELFDSATALSERAPLAAAVLRSALRGLYAEWELDGRDGWPSVAELYRAVASHIGRANMTRDTASEIRTSLLSRIDALLTGAGATAISGGPNAGIAWERLLEKPAVITLADYGDGQSRQLAFGLLLSGLLSYRRAHQFCELGHVTVLEEAHLLFAGGEGAGIAAQAVAGALATQRSAGEGFVLVTQLPQQLPAVINQIVSNRITHRLSGDAAVAVASAAGSASMSDHLTVLDRGEAVLWTAARQSGSSFVRIDPPPQVLAAAHPGFVAEPHGAVNLDGPDRIWCSSCPDPCFGREWLELVPDLATALLGDESPLQEQAEATALRAAHLASSRNLRVHAATLRPSVYCAVARTLTVVHAFDARRAEVALQCAAEVAGAAKRAADSAQRAREAQ